MNNNKALVLIDMQRKDGFSLENHATVIAHNVALPAAARERTIPVVYPRHINDNDLPPGEPLAADGKADSYRIGTYQVEIIEALAPHKGDMVIDKTRYSAFHKTDLDAQLKAKGIDTLIVT